MRLSTIVTGMAYLALVLFASIGYAGPTPQTPHGPHVELECTYVERSMSACSQRAPTFQCRQMCYLKGYDPSLRIPCVEPVLQGAKSVTIGGTPGVNAVRTKTVPASPDFYMGKKPGPIPVPVPYPF